MIVWPEEKRLKTESREGLRRFRDTSACAELEASTDQWTVVAWPWTSETPMRVMLENLAHHTITISMADTGIWMYEEAPRDVHLRSIEALDRDARGL
jgi:hypothetical protein